MLLDPKRQARTVTVLKKMEAIRPEEVAHVKEKSKFQVSYVGPHTNYFTAKNLCQVACAWYNFLVMTYEADPISKNDHWHITIIKDNYIAFYEWTVVYWEGLWEGRTSIFARTLHCFSGLFINLGIMRGRNNHGPAGLELLKLGVYNSMHDLVEECEYLPLFPYFMRVSLLLICYF